MGEQTFDRPPPDRPAAQGKRLLMWLMLSVLAALVGWLGFRAYLNPELLFQFANSLYC